MGSTWGDLPTWLIFLASAVNVGVLWWYAHLTKGIRKATLTTAKHTEDLVQQARSALKAQIVATVLQVEDRIAERAMMNPAVVLNPWQEMRAIRDALAQGFPDLWREIEPTLPRLWHS